MEKVAIEADRKARLRFARVKMKESPYILLYLGRAPGAVRFIKYVARREQQRQNADLSPKR